MPLPDLPNIQEHLLDLPEVVELRALSLCSEGQVWCSPERHGAVTAVMKNRIDWIPLACKEFDDAGRMRASSHYDRVVDVMEELVTFTFLMRGRTDYLTDRYSGRSERARQAIDWQLRKI